MMEYVCALAAVAASSCIATAFAAGTVYGHLNVSYHCIPVLIDTASACTACDIFDNSQSGNDTMWTETRVNAYDKNGNSCASYVRNIKSDAMEGRNAAKVNIRSISSAVGEHKGGSNNGRASTYTRWYR